MEKELFILSQSDWSLHRKGKEDQERHMEKIKEVIQQNMGDLVTEENIIMSDGKNRIKIPIRSLDQYHFRYNFDKQKHVGQGNGDSQVGDLIASSGNKQKGQKGAGKGQGAGDETGEDYAEAEISIAEIEEALFSELELPNLEKNKKQDQLENESYEFTDIRKKGVMGNIDKKRTIFESMKRQIRQHHDVKGLQIHPDDLRFKTWEEKKKPSTNAVIIAMMDTSGSMGIWEKYMSRSFFFWTARFLRTKYKNVHIRFVAHHTEAKEVDEETFFNRGESGGTICSSAYRKTLEIIDRDYPPNQFNIYAFHFSDGDNLTSDNARCVKLIEELMKKTNLFGYGEVNQYNRHSTLFSAYKNIQNDKFKHYIFKQKADIYHGLKAFFRKEK